MNNSDVTRDEYQTKIHWLKISIARLHEACPNSIEARLNLMSRLVAVENEYDFVCDVTPKLPVGLINLLSREVVPMV